MRLVSTPESVRQNEPSVLAIAETILACGFSFWLALRYGTWWHVAVGASIAPFLLLRTDSSCELGLVTFNRILRPFATSDSPFSERTRWLGLVPVAAFGSLFSKIYATVLTLCFRPIESVGAVPENWSRLVLSIDLRHSPEFIPVPLGPSQALSENKLDPRVYRLFKFSILIFVLSRGIDFGRAKARLTHKWLRDSLQVSRVGEAVDNRDTRPFGIRHHSWVSVSVVC